MSSVPLLLWVVLFSALGGIASAAVAVVFLGVSEARAARILPHFVSFATGALLGAALLALLPEAIEKLGAGGALPIGWTLVAGLAFFFVIEKVVLWWHTRGETRADDDHAAHDHTRAHASGVLVLIGDSIHNALDGMLIAAAFLDSTSVGLVTTLAVAAHEIPHRVGDFALLVHAGFCRRRALVLNLATGIASVIGAVVAYFSLQSSLGALPYALAFAAAGFLYIAVAGLIPGLHRRVELRTSVIQVLLIGAGIGIIAGAEQLAHQ